MKKHWIALLALVCLLVCMPAFADTADVKVTALATMETPYHQVTALFIEYPEAVVAPTVEDYIITDYQTFNFLEVYENRPYEMGAISAVYTSDVPAVREDKTSVPGKYVVIELKPVDGSYYDEAAGMWRPHNIAGIATVRTGGETCDHFRTDWSLFVVAQRNNVVNEAGAVVATPGVLPIIAADGVSTPEMERFTQECLLSENGLHNIYYNVSLPDNYDASKQYPVVFCQPGAGGSIDYNKQNPEGVFPGIGGNTTRDAIPVAFTRLDEELIVVTVQPWTNPPAEWEVDNPGDFIYLVDHIASNYAVNPERVYGLGNSKGTMMTSQALCRRPDLLTAYAQCNGGFTYVEDGKTNFFSVFTPEVTKTYVGYTEAQIWEIAGDPANRLDAETVAANGGKYLDGLVEARIPVYCFDGTNTEVLSPLYTLSTYTYLKERYEALGLSEEEINELVRVDLADDQEFLDRGVCEFHESTKIVAFDQYDVIPWLLSR